MVRIEVKVLTGDVVKKTEANMKARAWIKLFCGKIWVAGNEGSHVNKTGMARVGEFGDRISDTSVQPKFVHLLSFLM